MCSAEAWDVTCVCVCGGASFHKSQESAELQKEASSLVSDQHLKYHCYLTLRRKMSLFVRKLLHVSARLHPRARFQMQNLLTIKGGEDCSYPAVMLTYNFTWKVHCTLIVDGGGEGEAPAHGAGRECISITCSPSVCDRWQESRGEENPH